MTSSPAIFSQYLTAICANIGVFGLGTILGYGSPAGYILTTINSTDLHLNYNQNSWFTSCSNLGAMIGCPLAGFCLNRFGRKGTIILSLGPALLGWIIIISARNFYMLLTGRFVSGLYCSFISTSVPTYVGEFSSPHIRGTLGIIFQFMFLSGILFSVYMGALFNSFRVIGALCAIFPCVCSFLMLFLKESPVYLLSNDKHKEAEEAMEFFRGKHYNGILLEIEVFKTTLEEKKKRTTSFGDLRKLNHFHPLIMALGLFFFQEFSGIDAILFNLALIFKGIDSSLSENISSIIYCLVQYVGIVVGFVLIDRAGRKIILELSYFLMGISLALLGIFFYFDEQNHSITSTVSWVPLVCLTTYITSFSMGSGPVPWLMLGELFSPEVKELSACIVTMSNWMFAFIVSLLFHPLQKELHIYGVYWLFSGICFLSLIFTVTFLYETKGKSLQEINSHFEDNKFIYCK